MQQRSFAGTKCIFTMFVYATHAQANLGQGFRQMSTATAGTSRRHWRPVISASSQHAGIEQPDWPDSKHGPYAPNLLYFSIASNQMTVRAHFTGSSCHTRVNSQPLMRLN